MTWRGDFGAPAYHGQGAHGTRCTRERHTFAAAELAHTWAHEGTAWGNRSDKRMYFEADTAEISKRVQRVSTIYSYGRHFPIASLYHVKGKPVVLFTTENYSVSTTKHKTEVMLAITHMETYDVAAPREPESGEADFKRRLNASLVHARNPRVRDIKRTLDAIRETVGQGNAFAKAFGFKWRLKLPKDMAALDTRAIELDERRAVLNAVALVRAIREWRANPSALAPERVARGGQGYSAQHDWLDFTASPEWTPADTEELARRQANKVGIWRTYGGRADYALGTLLRVADGAHCTLDRELVGEIETSRGVRFPLAHGVRALPLIRRACERKGWTPEASKDVLWQSNGHAIHLGHYAIERIERRTDGVHVIAGCHDVPLAEVEQCAARLGL